MADGKFFNFVCCLVLILISARSLQIKAKDVSIRHNTCDSEENENGFCDSKDENKYLHNDEITDLKDEEPSLQKNEAVYNFSQDSTKDQPSSEIYKSLPENNDKQVYFNSNSTEEWTGLQIPVVDGVKAS